MGTLNSGVFNWHPGLLLQPSPADSAKEVWRAPALVVLNQPLKPIWALKRLWANSLYRVAADGGANRLYDVKTDTGEPFDNLDVIIGDLDSLSPRTADHFRAISSTKIIHDPDQYSTDFGKAVHHIRSSHPGVDIVALGGLGGRVDQGLSQLHHLYLFQRDDEYSEGRMYLLSGESLTFLLKAGRHKIWVRDGREEVFGKHVGIIPVKGPSVITTKGLEWDVTNWETEFGGQISTSNHVLPQTEVVEVETDKDVIFTIALRE